MALTICTFALTIILVLSFLTKRFPKVQNALNKLKDKLVFGMFLGIFIKGHLNLFVKMLGPLTGTVSFNIVNLDVASSVLRSESGLKRKGSFK